MTAWHGHSMTVLQAIVVEVILFVNVYSKYTTAETYPWGHIAGDLPATCNVLWGEMLI